MKIITCKQCGEVKQHYAKGLCGKCYNKNLRIKKYYKQLLSEKILFLKNDTIFRDIIKYTEDKCEINCIFEKISNVDYNIIKLEKLNDYND